MTRVDYMHRQAGVACKSQNLKERGRRQKDQPNNLKNYNDDNKSIYLKPTSSSKAKN